MNYHIGYVQLRIGRYAREIRVTVEYIFHPDDPFGQSMAEKAARIFLSEQLALDPKTSKMAKSVADFIGAFYSPTKVLEKEDTRFTNW